MDLGGWYYTPLTCKVSFAGPVRRTIDATLTSGGKVRVGTTGLKPGRYRTSVRCGDDAPFELSDVAIVPKGTSAQGSCQVAESGFSYNLDRRYVTVGVILRNSNPLVPSLAGELIFNFFDATGNIIQTESGDMGPVPAGTSRPVGAEWSISSTPVRVQVVATCMEPGPLFPKEPFEFVPVTGAASMTDYDVVISGTVTNTWNRTLDGSSFWGGSAIRYVTRDASGTITGGGKADLGDASPPPGVSVKWMQSNRGLSSAAQATQVQAVFTPDFKD
jgi:hypothetical protein